MTLRPDSLWRLDSEVRPNLLSIVGTAIAIGALVYSSEIVSGLLGTTSIVVGPELVFLGLALASVGLFIVWHNERIWVTSAILGYAAMMFRSSPGIGPQELVFAVIVLGGIVGWFAKEWLNRRVILRSGFDALLLGFVILGTFTSLLGAYLNDLQLLRYYKEWSIIFSMLLYFPIRNQLRNEKDVRFLMAIFLMLALSNSVVSVTTYKSRLASAVFAWEVEASRTAGGSEPIAIAAAIIGISVFSYSRQRRTMLLGLALSAIGLLSMAITFSRGPIIAGVIGMIVVAFSSPWRVARRTFMAMASALVAGSIVVALLFPVVATTVGKSLALRLMSTGSGFADLSLRARLVESTVLLEKYVPRSPIFGYGFGVDYIYASPVVPDHTTHTTFIHNGIVWAMYKFGIPVALLFYFLLIYPLLRFLLKPVSPMHLHLRAISACVIGYIVAALVMNFTSSQFTNYTAVLNFSLCWAFLDYVNRRYEIPAASGELAFVDTTNGRVGGLAG